MSGPKWTTSVEKSHRARRSRLGGEAIAVVSAVAPGGRQRSRARNVYATLAHSRARIRPARHVRMQTDIDQKCGKLGRRHPCSVHPRQMLAKSGPKPQKLVRLRTVSSGFKHFRASLDQGCLDLGRSVWSRQIGKRVRPKSSQYRASLVGI